MRICEPGASRNINNLYCGLLLAHIFAFQRLYFPFHWPHLQSDTCPYYGGLGLVCCRAVCEMSGILHYFPPASSLPIAAGTGIGEAGTREANCDIRCVIAECGRKKKRKAYTAFSKDQRAEISKYAAGNGNNAALFAKNSITGLCRAEFINKRSHK